MPPKAAPSKGKKGKGGGDDDDEAPSGAFACSASALLFCAHSQLQAPATRSRWGTSCAKSRVRCWRHSRRENASMLQTAWLTALLPGDHRLHQGGRHSGRTQKV